MGSIKRLGAVSVTICLLSISPAMDRSPTPVRAAAAGCGAADAASVTGVKGRAGIREPHGKWQPARKNMRVRAGASARTEQGGLLSLHMCSGAGLIANGNTQVALSDRQSAHVTKGEVDSILKSSTQHLQAAGATAKRSGSHRANVDVRVSGSTALITTVEGAAGVSSKSGRVVVDSNHQTRVIGNRAPSHPVTVDATTYTTWANRFTWKTVAQLGAAKPTRLAIDGQGNMFVTEEFAARVDKISPSGKVLATWSTATGEPSPYSSRPFGIALDPAGNVYVADAGREQVVKYSPAGQQIAAWGTYGSDPGQFNFPEGIALDSAGNIYVADTGNDRIQKLSPNGDPLAQWGTAGTSLGQFRTVVALALDRAGNIYAADWGDSSSPDRVIKIASSGQFLAQWVGPPTLPGFYNFPFDLTVDTSGNVYVAESGIARILELSPSGQQLALLGSHGTGPGQFQYGEPNGVALDAGGNLYTTEEDAHRIQRYSAEG